MTTTQTFLKEEQKSVLMKAQEDKQIRFYDFDGSTIIVPEEDFSKVGFIAMKSKKAYDLLMEIFSLDIDFCGTSVFSDESISFFVLASTSIFERRNFPPEDIHEIYSGHAEWIPLEEVQSGAEWLMDELSNRRSRAEHLQDLVTSDVSYSF